MKIYDYETIKKYHEKQITICQCANSLRQKYQEICKITNIKITKLEDFKSLAKPYWVRHYLPNGGEFWKGENTNLNATEILFSELILHDYAKNNTILADFGHFMRAIDILRTREKRNQRRLHTITTLDKDSSFAVDEDSTNSAGISYIERFILKRN